MKTSPSKDIQRVLLLAALLAIVFSPLIFSRKTIIGGDIVFQNYPRMMYMRQRLLAGEVPLWAANIYAGSPIAAEGQTGVFYPPNLLLPALPPELAPNAMFLLHVFMAGLFMFILSRRLGAGPRGALFAGLAYAANGMALTHAQHLNIVYAMAWAPLPVALADAALAARGARAAALGALAGAAAAAMLLGGHPQFVFFALLALGVFYPFAARRRRAALSSAVAAAVSLGLTFILISAIQIIPQLELARLSVRPGNISYGFFTSGSLSPKMLISLLFPRFWGAPWDATWHAGGPPDEVLTYLCALPLLLACAALWNRRLMRAAWPFAALAVFGALWALGGYTPLAKLLYHVPVLNAFRVPARAMFFVMFGGALLSGIGMDALAGEARERGGPGRGAMWLAALAGAAASAGGLAVLLLKSKLAEMLLSRMSQPSGAAHPHEYYAEKAGILVSMIGADVLMLGLALLTVAALIAARARGGKASGAIYAAATALAVICLSLTALTGLNITTRGVLLHRPVLLDEVRAGRNFNRIYFKPGTEYLAATHQKNPMKPYSPEYWRRCFDTMDFDLPLLSGVPSINGYGQLTLWDFQMLAVRKQYAPFGSDRSKLRQFDRAEKNAGALDPLKPADHAVLRMLKVNRVISAAPGGRRLEVSTLVPPGVEQSQFWAECDKFPGRPPWYPGLEPLMTKVQRPAAGRIIADVDMPCRGNLVLMEKYYPGWSVRSRGTGKPVHSFERSAGIGVKLGPGKHSLEYVFAPSSVRKGLALGLAGLALAFICTLPLIARKNRAGA